MRAKLDIDEYETKLFDASISFNGFHEDSPSPRMLIEPWLSEGSIAEFFGDKGIGKSWLVSSIAVALTRKNYEGIEIGPWKVKAPAGVLYIDGEMPISEMRKRITLLEDVYGEESSESPLKIISSLQYAEMDGNGIQLGQKKIRSDITTWFENNPEYSVLVLDNISTLTMGLHENLASHWQPINEWIIKLRNRQVSTIFAHHPNKQGQQRGTSAREDNIDIIYNLIWPVHYKSSDAVYFVARNEKRRNVPPIHPLDDFTMRLVTDPLGRLTWSEGDAKEAGFSDRDMTIYTLLLVGVPGKGIATRVSLSPGAITPRKKLLENRGYLDKVTGDITEKGRDLLENFRKINPSIFIDYSDLIDKQGKRAVAF